MKKLTRNTVVFLAALALILFLGLTKTVSAQPHQGQGDQNATDGKQNQQEDINDDRQDGPNSELQEGPNEKEMDKQEEAGDKSESLNQKHELNAHELASDSSHEVETDNDRVQDQQQDQLEQQGEVSESPAGL